MRIVIAPDKFKGSLTADEVAAHLATGLQRARGGTGGKAADAAGVGSGDAGSGDVGSADEYDLVPMADGGEGTLDAALGSGFTRHTVTVAGPTGHQLGASFALSGTTAVVEMAVASGLDVLPGGVLDARGATSEGTGQLIAAALDAGADHIILGVGGSACTDGGSGLLVGLGARLLDEHGRALPAGGAALAEIGAVDLSGLDPRVPRTRFTLASDVDNPLLGPNGAASVFGPQKGAGADDVTYLDAALTRFVAALAAEAGPDAEAAAAAAGAGAAGGVGYAALAVLGARRRAGIDVVLDFTDLPRRLAGADLVITGEGSLDEQSLGGKTPIGVARAAAAVGVPVIAVCGRTTLTHQALTDAGFASAHALTDLEPDPAVSMARAGDLLETVGATIAAGLPDTPPARRRPAGRQ